MKHFEDLSIDDVLYTIEHINDFNQSEKIDGSAIQFGIDNNGFYTSREHKKGKRYYSVDDYPIMFWTSGFRSAHMFLETIKDTIEKDKLYTAEIVYGSQPNTIAYNCGHHIIVFDDIITKCGYVKLSVPASNGKKIMNMDVEDFWTICSVPKFNTIYKINSNDLYDYITSFNETYTNITNKEIYSLKTNTKPPFANDIKQFRQVWKNVQDNVQNFLMNIKKHLIEQSPSKSFGEEIEGIVFVRKCDGKDIEFKLVDKQKFTMRNIENHYTREEIRKQMYKIKKKLAEIIGIPDIGDNYKRNSFLRQYGTTKQEQIKNISKNYSNDYDVKLLKPLIIEYNKMFKEYKNNPCMDIIHFYNLQEFATGFNFIYNAIKSKTIDDMISLYIK
jgi:hypothetical protein